ncbi:MAG: ATP synthase F1 subunit epsilon [Erysipelotrichaceae bacterium]|jgi:F-type H+-transporting ATPase subunit epsilon|nr:ATP synthase F1 subunit epsilon [Erysipelotrichaceae bacterium]
MKFKTDLITYEGVYRSIQTEKLNLPTSEGRRTILANHMPIMIPLQVGVIETDEEEGLKHYAINGGVMYFKDNVAEIVADNIVDVEEIDIEKARADKEKEEEKLAKAKREYERIRAKDKLEIEENLLRAAEKYNVKKE